MARDEARALLDACGGGTRGVRNRAVLTLQYRAGLRCSESLSVRVCDVKDLESGASIVRVEFPKGIGAWASPREVGLDPASAALVRAWRELRGSAAPTDPLFVTPRGKTIDSSYFRRLVPQLARKAGIYRRVHPHCLRHTFAKELYEEGVGVLQIMQALGHQSLNTTQIYLEGLGVAPMIEATTGREW